LRGPAILVFSWQTLCASSESYASPRLRIRVRFLLADSSV
jgi:hypothetical protein